MDRDGGVLRDIKIAVEKKTAHTVLSGGNQEGSILTSYADDDTGFWKGLRCDLIKDGLPSAAIHKHKHLIKEYIRELGARGILDDDSSKETDQQLINIDAHSGITEEVQELPNNRIVNRDIPQTHDQDIDIQRSENFTEQSLSDSLDNIIVEDVESQPRPADPRAPVSQKMEEPPHKATEDVGIQSGTQIKSQFDYDNSNPLQPVYTELEWKDSLARDHIMPRAAPIQRDQRTRRRYVLSKSRGVLEILVEDYGSSLEVDEEEEEDRRRRERREREAAERDLQTSRRGKDRRGDVESKSRNKFAFVEDDGSDSELDDEEEGRRTKRERRGKEAAEASETLQRDQRRRRRDTDQRRDTESKDSEFFDDSLNSEIGDFCYSKSKRESSLEKKGEEEGKKRSEDERNRSGDKQRKDRDKLRRRSKREVNEDDTRI